jgi:hypothetical protein
MTEYYTIITFLKRVPDTISPPVQGVVNHTADIDPPYSSHDGILHYSYFSEKGT